MYFPRLEIDFEFQPRAVSVGLDDVPLAGLSTRLSEIATSPVRARQVAGVTILSGQVNSVSLAEKLAIIASFEPGVERIENRIEVR